MFLFSLFNKKLKKKNVFFGKHFISNSLIKKNNFLLKKKKFFNFFLNNNNTVTRVKYYYNFDLRSIYYFLKKFSMKFFVKTLKRKNGKAIKKLLSKNKKQIYKIKIKKIKKTRVRRRKKFFFYFKNIKKYIIKQLILLLITHNLNMFLKRLCTLLQNKKRFFILKTILFFKNINNTVFTKRFKVFNIGGFYIRFSGKLGGSGGSKKIRRIIVWGKPNLSNYNYKLERCQNSIWSYAGTTNVSAYMSTKI